MNILYVTMTDLVGQRFNGHLLHHALQARGHDARMLVIHRHSGDATVHGYPRWMGTFERGLYGAERVTSLQGLLSPIALTFPLRACYRRAELLHWHLVAPHYISVPLMPWVAASRPTVWTIHDPWPTTGHCVHPAECERWRTGCGKCPDLKRSFTVYMDTTRPLWKNKQATFRRMAITLVAPSRWIQSRVQASPLTSHWPCHVIPPGLDLAVWRRRDRAACRAQLGIPPEARVLAFRMPVGEKQRHLKGIPWTIEALQRLTPRRPVHLIVFQDQGQLGALADKYTIHELGWVTDSDRIADALTAADIFLVPSVAETAPTMALESMACGTAVIVSNSTGMPDMVRAPQAGVTVPVGDAEALAQAIAQLLDDDGLRMAKGEAGRRIVEAEHSYDLHVERHVALYADVLERSRRDR